MNRDGEKKINVDQVMDLTELREVIKNMTFSLQNIEAAFKKSLPFFMDDITMEECGNVEVAIGKCKKAYKRAIHLLPHKQGKETSVLFLPSNTMALEKAPYEMIQQILSATEEAYRTITNAEKKIAYENLTSSSASEFKSDSLRPLKKQLEATMQFISDKYSFLSKPSPLASSPTPPSDSKTKAEEEKKTFDPPPASPATTVTVPRDSKNKQEEQQKDKIDKKADPIKEFKSLLQSIPLPVSSQCQTISLELLVKSSSATNQKIKNLYSLASQAVEAGEASCSLTRNALQNTQMGLDIRKDPKEGLHECRETIGTALRQVTEAKRKLTAILETVGELGKSQSPPAKMKTKEEKSLDSITKAAKSIKTEPSLSKEIEDARALFLKAEKTLTEVATAIHDKCYHPLAVHNNKNYAKNSQRVDRINKALQNIADNLDAITQHATSLGFEAAGISELRDLFSPLLLLGTIHKNDLKLVVTKLKKMVKHISDNVPQTLPQCKIIYQNLKEVEENLGKWRTAVWENRAALFLKFGATIATGGASIAIPALPVISSVLSSQLPTITTPVAPISSAFLTTTIEKTSKALVGVGSNFVADKLSLTTDLNPPMKAPQQPTHLAGISDILIENDEKGNTRLRPSSHLRWESKYTAKFLKTMAEENRGKMLVALASLIVGGAVLAPLGVTTPVALSLLAAGGVYASCAIDVLTELQRAEKEEEVMRSIGKDLQRITRHLNLLAFGGYHKNFEDYYNETLQFINEALELKEPSTSILDTQTSPVFNTPEQISKMEEVKKILNEAIQSSQKLCAVGVGVRLDEIITKIQAQQAYVREIENKLNEIPKIGHSPLLKKKIALTLARKKESQEIPSHKKINKEPSFFGLFEKPKSYKLPPTKLQYELMQMESIMKIPDPLLRINEKQKAEEAKKENESEKNAQKKDSSRYIPRR